MRFLFLRMVERVYQSDAKLAILLISVVSVFPSDKIDFDVHCHCPQHGACPNLTLDWYVPACLVESVYHLEDSIPMVTKNVAAA